MRKIPTVSRVQGKKIKCRRQLWQTFTILPEANAINNCHISLERA